MHLVQQTLENSKSEDISIIPLAGKSDMADYMVVASGTSSRHVGSIAEKLMFELKHQGNYDDIRSEGLDSCNWVLIDAMDVIVHIFKPEVREFYNIEKMWAMSISAEIPTTELV